MAMAEVAAPARHRTGQGLMLHTYPLDHARTSLSQCTWIDLVDPTDEERAAVERAFGLRVPTRDELREIETSSRLQIEDGTLYMTAPLILANGGEPWIPEPTGFVLAKHVLLTVRSMPSLYFDKVVAEIARHSSFDPAFAFVRILEEIVAHMADLLETTSNELDDASHVIFRAGRRPKLSHEAALLRQLMIRTGRTSERMARIHYTLLCLDRMAKFTQDRCRDWIAQNLCADLQAISSDVTSLVQFVEGVVSRVQLLQDAATGIINIDQNDVMKVLTIASVVGIPPVLVAGIYGMNFKMPEYEWSWGYSYALALIVITALLPLLWFKWKDWI
jgi:magnesium transporter